MTLTRYAAVVAVFMLTPGLALAGSQSSRQDPWRGKPHHVVGSEIAPVITGGAQWGTKSNVPIVGIQWGTKSCTDGEGQGIPEDA